MPNLPTILIDDPVVFDRVVAAFGSAAEYKAWLKRSVRQEVMRRETREIRQSADAAIDAKVKELDNLEGTMQ